MSDGIRPTDRDAWIPRPQRIDPTRRRPRREPGEQGDEEPRDFRDRLEDGAKTLRPERRRVVPDEAGANRDADEEPSRAGREEGLGGDLDLLA